MSIHTITIRRNDDPKNVFTDAVPPIPAGSEVYMQNVSQNGIWISETADMSQALLLTAAGTSTSVGSLESGDDAFVDTDEEQAVLKLQVANV